MAQIDSKNALEGLLRERTDLRAKERVQIVEEAAAAGLLSEGTHTTPNGTVRGLAPQGAPIWELSEADEEWMAGKVHWPYSSYERALAGADEHAGRFAEGAGPWKPNGISFAYENHPAMYTREVPGIGFQHLKPRFLDS